ncbi:MAG TPA: hypothetical protein VEV37_11715 [Bryobacteraceae bacterium]|nr:hypothetical protein [Bryobacteraceae bacterium]
MVSLVISTGLPDLSVTWKLTVGELPGVAFWIFKILRTIPGSIGELFGTSCAPGMDASNANVSFET